MPDAPDRYHYRIVPFGADSPLVASAEALYRAVWQEDLPSLRRHAGYPGFKGLVALTAGDEPIGFVYGTTTLPDHWWAKRVAPVIGPRQAQQILIGSFVVTELVVLPEHRRHGLGTRLMRAVLADLPHPTATLSTEVDNAPARALYERLGFGYLVDEVRFREGWEPHVVMWRSLPLPEIASV